MLQLQFYLRVCKITTIWKYHVYSLYCKFGPKVFTTLCKTYLLSKTQLPSCAFPAPLISSSLNRLISLNKMELQFVALAEHNRLHSPLDGDIVGWPGPGVTQECVTWNKSTKRRDFSTFFSVGTMFSYCVRLRPIDLVVYGVPFIFMSMFIFPWPLNDRPVTNKGRDLIWVARFLRIFSWFLTVFFLLLYATCYFYCRCYVYIGTYLIQKYIWSLRMRSA